MLKYLVPMTFFCLLAAMIGCTVSQPTAEQAYEATAVPMLEPVDVCATPNADWPSCFTPTPEQGADLTTTELAIDSQYGITLTAVSAFFDPEITTIDFLAVVDPLWQMDATAFPPQQALIYPTFPDSLVDNDGQPMALTGRAGGQATNTSTGGIQQMMYHQWEGISAEATVVTATVTVDLSNLYRQIEIPLDWTSHQEGDVWVVDVPIELGYATADLHQIEWEDNHPDGRARLTFSVASNSPNDIRLYCLHLDIEDPWRNECANFEEEKSYTILLQPGEPIVLHVRASLELLTPFVFDLATD